MCVGGGGGRGHKGCEQAQGYEQDVFVTHHL